MRADNLEGTGHRTPDATAADILASTCAQNEFARGKALGLSFWDEVRGLSKPLCKFRVSLGRGQVDASVEHHQQSSARVSQNGVSLLVVYCFESVAIIGVDIEQCVCLAV